MYNYITIMQKICRFSVLFKMLEIETKIRKWGNSFGVVVPVGAFQKLKIKEGEPVRIFLEKKENPLKKTFGILKIKRKTEDILREADNELWGKNE